MVKKILGVFVAIIVIILIAGALMPADFHVERSMVINAPAEKAFEQVNDFSKWNAWSPWAKLDPNAKYTISQNPVGKGATYEWEGNNEVGAGKMMIVESTAPSIVNIQLDFLKPFEGSNQVHFTFKQQQSQTLVTWAMDGRRHYLCKVMSLFISTDKMVGGMFEKGLLDIKNLAEAK